jgi:hypothetical protein
MMRILASWQGSFAAILVFLALFVSGCTMDATSDTRIDVERPEGHAAIPLSIGVYLSPEFLAVEDRHRSGGLGGTTMIFRFGQTSADLFDGVFNAAFEEVHFVKARPPLALDGPKVAAVIEPRIERAKMYGRVGTFTAELVYLFRLYDGAGNVVLSWNTSGQALSNPEGKFIFDGAPQPVQDNALKQAGENLMRSLYNDPRILTWLQSQGVDLVAK